MNGGGKVQIKAKFCFAPKLAPKSPMGLQMGRLCPTNPKGIRIRAQNPPASKKKEFFQKFDVFKNVERNPPVYKTPPLARLQENAKEGTGGAEGLQDGRFPPGSTQMETEERPELKVKLELS